MSRADIDWRDRVGDDPALTGVVAVTVVALLARLVDLGGRIAHFDEGRVAYWALEYAETGSISYRYIVHGPLVQYVDASLFQLLGTGDAVMRLPVALFGGLLPLSALLFREHLRDSEVVALAVVLAANPVLLYYSRFFRSTLLVAGFVFVAFGLAVRAHDTRRIRYVYGVAALFALALAAKENAVVYAIIWVGATGLVVDQIFFAERGEERGLDVARGYWGWLRDRGRALGLTGVGRYAGHLAGAVLLFALITVFFFAPRNPADGVGLWYALGHPTSLPTVIDATIADLSAGFEYWFGGTSDPGCHKDNVIDSYACFLGRFLETLAVAALPLSVLAVGGFLIERYGAVRPRPVVLFASYWGFVSVLGYPLGTDIYGAWITVNALVPLALPAAVGLAYVYRQGQAVFDEGDAVSGYPVGVVLLVLTAQVATTAGGLVYASPASADNNLVQYAQPTDDYRPVLEMAADADTGEGTDVLIYGSKLATAQDLSPQEPACGDLAQLLPMQWYVARHDLEADCAVDRAALEERGDRPPVIVARGSNATYLESRLDGYTAETYDFRASGAVTTFFVRDDVAAPPASTD